MAIAGNAVTGSPAEGGLTARARRGVLKGKGSLWSIALAHRSSGRRGWNAIVEAGPVGQGRALAPRPAWADAATENRDGLVPAPIDPRPLETMARKTGHRKNAARGRLKRHPSNGSAVKRRTSHGALDKEHARRNPPSHSMMPDRVAIIKGLARSLARWGPGPGESRAGPGTQTRKAVLTIPA